MTSDVSVYDLLSDDRRAMHSVTGALYKKILADDLLAPYFRSADIDRQASMLAEFLAMAFGGPHSYSGHDLRTAHAQLPGLTDMHFDLVVSYLADTLREFGLADGDIATMAAVAETVRDDVLNR